VAKTTVENAPENAKLEAKNYYFCPTCLKCCLQFSSLGAIVLFDQSHLVFFILLNCYLLLFRQGKQLINSVLKICFLQNILPT